MSSPTPPEPVAPKESKEKFIEEISSDDLFKETGCRDLKVCKGFPSKHLLCFLPQVNKICPRTCNMC